MLSDKQCKHEGILQLRQNIRACTFPILNEVKWKYVLSVDSISYDQVFRNRVVNFKVMMLLSKKYMYQSDRHPTASWSTAYAWNT